MLHVSSAKVILFSLWCTKFSCFSPYKAYFFGVFEEKCTFFSLFFRNCLVVQKKAVPLHSQNGNDTVAPWNTEQQIKKFAEIAQLVEHNLAKVRVASSSLVFRSKVWICVYNRRVGVSPGGGMVDALVSGASVERRAGSSPVLGTKPNEYLTYWTTFGEMAELVDALLWGGSDRWVVWVRVSFSSRKMKHFAEIAQLVEHNLAKVRVASSSLVFRSK